MQITARVNTEYLSDGTDLNKLAYSVAMAETGNCKNGVGKTHKNCFGIKKNGKFAKYSSTDESYKDFKRVWKKYYKTYPDNKLANRWTGGDSVVDWLNIVNHFYNK